MAARKRVIQLGIRLSKFQEINAGCRNRLQSSRDSVNFYNSLSSNSSGHRLDYKQISQLDKPIGERVYLVDTMSPEHHFALLQLETEKLRNCIEKMRGELLNNNERMHGELRYEIYKGFADLRLDLKQEFHELRARREAAKYDIKYLIGTLVSLYAVGIGMIGIFATKK